MPAPTPRILFGLGEEDGRRVSPSSSRLRGTTVFPQLHEQTYKGTGRRVVATLRRNEEGRSDPTRPPLVQNEDLTPCATCGKSLTLAVLYNLCNKMWPDMTHDPAGPPRDSIASWLRLAKPIPATFGDQRLMVLDLGASGALLSGQCDFEQGAMAELSFLDGRGNVTVLGLVTGVADHGTSPHRDLLVRFHDRGTGLTEFIARYEEQIRRAEIANANGDIDHNVIDGDRMLSDLGLAARSNEPFLRCQLNAGVWTRTVTERREQPPDGFTISAAETEDQVMLLQLAYEEADEDSRRALREFAAVSLP